LTLGYGNPTTITHLLRTNKMHKNFKNSKFDSPICISAGLYVKFSRGGGRGDGRRGGVRDLGFDIRTGTMPQLGMSTWKITRSAGVCIQKGQREGEGLI